ncbi:uncharacterized protein LOC125869861 [Solanum stenotomum]|uniref:uncharacterized protein LOC125869861 n=1 Tax=Solanum stenotomum TaxID=172797 RepID=UPI0020D0519F|nr:uncharacterized protein LOC125869861 [Solanum stenotomum]
MVDDSGARKNKFLMGVSSLVVNECRSAMLIPRMNISSLMVDAKQIEEHNLKKMNREVKKARTGDGNFSNAKFDGQGRQRFKQRFSNQHSSSDTPIVNKDRVSNRKPQGGYEKRTHIAKPTCAKYGKKHDGKCLTSVGVCYGCGKSGHQLNNCPTVTTKGREDKQTPPSGSNSNAQKQNHFNALQSQEDQESSQDVVTDTGNQYYISTGAPFIQSGSKVIR